MLGRHSRVVVVLLLRPCNAHPLAARCQSSTRARAGPIVVTALTQCSHMEQETTLDVRFNLPHGSCNVETPSAQPEKLMEAYLWSSLQSCRTAEFTGKCAVFEQFQGPTCAQSDDPDLAPRLADNGCAKYHKIPTIDPNCRRLLPPVVAAESAGSGGLFGLGGQRSLVRACKQ